MTTEGPQDNQQLDVLIIGAGISGIGAACHLKRECPEKSFLILERRQAVGGTWDLFRYPGIRSDSDMLTFGFEFRPWTGSKILADGPSIKQYIADTAREYNLFDKIRFGSRVSGANWNSQREEWEITVQKEGGKDGNGAGTGQTITYRAGFVINCTGYYNYDKGYKPDFPGEEKFKGTQIHPQHWPEDLDYTNKKVIVIGSGATAITLVPSLSKKAKHVTMLQRSPTYIVSLPEEDAVAGGLMNFLPRQWVYHLARGRNILMQRTMYWLAQERPGPVRRFILSRVKEHLDGKVDIRHFSPDYKPWDQRLCVVPEADLFRVLKEGRAEVVTDTIETFTEKGIRLKSGRELEADIIVTATGLDVQMLGGVEASMDGKPVKVADHLVYKGVLLEGLPNAAMIFGYTNASWTLKVDIAATYICRLLKFMDKNNYRMVTPRDREGCKTNDTVMGSLRAGYIKRAADRLPRQGSKGPWKVSNDYFQDIPLLKYMPLEDSVLEFQK